MGRILITGAARGALSCRESPPLTQPRHRASSLSLSRSSDAARGGASARTLGSHRGSRPAAPGTPGEEGQCGGGDQREREDGGADRGRPVQAQR